MEMSHISETGAARMVDVSRKRPVRRVAVARGRIVLQPETIGLIRENLVKKGDVLGTARVAGISAAKRTWDLIPLCHQVGIEHVDVGFTLLDDGIDIESRAVCTDKTGIEMEALTAVSVAALTVYDMCKGVDKTMRIEGIRLVEKRKAGSGE